MCQFGASCTRPVCFFAHGDHQLRHTGMPGGPQPVVAPPEPNPALPGAGYNTVTDPVLKQQQQLIALQQAAAGFSSGQINSNQMRNDALLPMVDPMQAAGQGYPSLLDRGGSMDMSALQRELSTVSSYASGLPASAPLSAPLPQLSPDLVAALNMSQTLSPAPPAHQAAALSPNGLLHQHSGIPGSYQSAQLQNLAGGSHLQRSYTTLQDNADPAIMGELAKQLAMMQLMQQQNGAANASSPLSQMVNNGLDDSLMGQLAQLQHKQHQQQQQVAVTAGLDLQNFLAGPAASAGMMQQDSSYSCPLPSVYGNPNLAGLQQGSAGAVASPRVPHMSAADGTVMCQQLQIGNLSAGPASPTGSGKDAPAVSSRRDTQDDGTGTKKTQQAWSAPVSPCTSSKGCNDLQVAANDIRMSSISFSTTGGRSSPTHSNNSNNTGSPSSVTASDNLAGLNSISELGALASSLPSFDAGGVPAARCGDEMLMGDNTLHHVLAGGESAAAVAAAVSGGMGKDKAAQLLGQLPEAAVMKLLQLVAQQQ